MDSGAWQGIVHRVTNSWTRLKQLKQQPNNTKKDTIGENWGRGEWLRAGPGIFSQKQQLSWAPEVEGVAEGREGEKYSRLRE